MKTSRTKTKLWISSLIALGAIILSVFLSYTTLYQTLELKLLDLNFAIRGPLPINDSPIVIVAIDDQSDEATPHRWPWPRSYYAHVIENLEEAGAAVIGIDVILQQHGHSVDRILIYVWCIARIKFSGLFNHIRIQCDHSIKRKFIVALEFPYPVNVEERKIFIGQFAMFDLLLQFRNAFLQHQ